MNQFSKETVFFFTFCSSFLLFVFIYIFIFFYIFSVGLYTICNRKCESDHAQMLYFLLMRSAFCCGVLLTTCSQTSNSIAVSHFPFPVSRSPFPLPPFSIKHPELLNQMPSQKIVQLLLLCLVSGKWKCPKNRNINFVLKKKTENNNMFVPLITVGLRRCRQFVCVENRRK